MIKRIFFVLVFTIFIILVGILFFLSTKGYETDKFNNLISTEITKKNADLDIKLEKIKIKFDLPNFNLFLSTTNPMISYQNITPPINKLKIYLDFIPLLKSRVILDNLEITIGEVKISELKKLILRSKPSNIKSFILNDISKGKIKSNIFLSFADNNEIKDYRFNGKIKEMDLDFAKKLRISNIKLNFIADNDLILFNSIQANLMNLPISNGSLEIKTQEKISLKGKLESQINFNDKQIKNLISNLKKDFSFNNKIELKGKFLNSFLLQFNKKLKVENYNFDLSGNIENSKISFKEPIKTSILKDNINILNFEKSSIKLNFNKQKNEKILIEGLYSFNKNTKKNKFTLNSKILKSGIDTDLMLDITDELFVKFINYKKDGEKKASIRLKINNDNSNILKIKSMEYNEGDSRILIKDLKLDNNKIKTLKEVTVKTYKENLANNDFIVSFGKKIYIKGNKYDSTNLIELINEKNKENNLSFISKDIDIKLDNIITKLSIPLRNFILLGKLEKGKFIKIISKSEFSDNKFLDISLKKDEVSKKKIFELYSDLPKPILADYKFFSGIEGGKLLFLSTFDDETSMSNLTIENFKVINAPGFAKLLALADLRGIEDLLRGEGLSFEQLDIKMTQDKKILKVEELFAVGPSISILMEGFIDNESKLTSLRGTMVPARELNKLISKIPLLGDILIPKEIGEGLFGVSFKLKGTPGNIKTTVNPIKTLTPRFITKALEKRKKN